MNGLQEDEYACAFCGRILKGEVTSTGAVIFVHDDVFHPPEHMFDDESNPQ